MTRQTLIKGLIAVALGAQVFGLTPSVLNDCQAQEGIKTIHQLKKPAWVALGGKFQRGISVVTNQSGSSIRVFGVGADDARWTIESADKGKTWGNLIDHKGLLLSAPSCDDEYRLGEKGVRCTWLSSSGFLWSQYQKDGGGDGEFVTMGGKNMTSDPSFVSGWIFVHGADDNALWRSQTSLGKLTGEWVSLGGELKGSPSCVKVGEYPPPFFGAPASPMIRCYVIGTDDAVWEEHSEQTQSQVNKALWDTSYVWKKIGGEAIGGVNAWLVKGGKVLAVHGTDSALWLARETGKLGANPQYPTLTVWSGDFGTWENFPGKIASVPACSHSYCFAILPDGQLGFLDLTGRL